MEKMIKHIIYRTTHKITGEYYIGLHKWDTTRPIHYWGTYWMHQPKSVRPHLVRETLAEYPDRESARQAEPHWIAPHLGDPLCMNSHARELKEEQDRCDKPATNRGKKASNQALENMSIAQKGKQHWLGKKHTEESRKKISIALSGEKHPMWGKPSVMRGKSISEETREKIGKAQLGRPAWNKGKKLSSEHREKISKGGKGRVVNEETRDRLSLALKGKPKPQAKVQCPHCGKIGGKQNMTRYHFDNCKKNPLRLK